MDGRALQAGMDDLKIMTPPHGKGDLLYSQPFIPSVSRTRGTWMSFAKFLSEYHSS
jgi:hypothetical protein